MASQKPSEPTNSIMVAVREIAESMKEYDLEEVEVELPYAEKYSLNDNVKGIAKIRIRR